ncbi:kinesin-like protein KIN-7L isoform X1 [Zingiber officinale]|uniref:kinesin-like protein KIN-7L isoform X1 n=1 Tax=Zingiber officinale TaxID=94328 RepID=UPI001C4AB37C|nr:kinesin-like protein KIN-7L isoform X1 [Zingiber officinale]
MPLGSFPSESGSLSSLAQPMEKISVAVRFRPPAAVDPSPDRIWKVDDNRISLHRPLGTPISGVNFAFDYVFDPSYSNAMVYDLLIKSIIQAAIDGFNGTAFAYGQTSSGKTFTMNGSEEDPGIITLGVKDVFRRIEMTTDREFLIRVSYMEIYNEEINDLLSFGNQKLPVHESLERGIYVSGLREEIVNCSEQVIELLKLGEANRHFGETNMNARSSRSHTIFRMVIESSARDSMKCGDVSNADAIRVSVLNLVDLAGSERVAKTGAGGARLREGKHINKSLMILGNVINKLSESGKQRGHIPYRDSKLTRILQPALGGNSKTSIICTVAPEEVHVEESRGTLQFASRAKRITNCAQVNEILTDAALLKRQKQEIEELREKLQGSHSEVLEQVILKQRNDMHKSELERERLAMELEKERTKRAALELCIKDQQKKLEDLGSLSTSDYASVSTQQKKGFATMFDDTSVSKGEVLRTPNFKPVGDDFVAKRSSSFMELDSSPSLEAFGNTDDEDLWMQLNKGCITDLDMLQVTPDMKCRPLPSFRMPHEPALDEDATTKICHALATECDFNKQQLEALREKCTIMESECTLLKDKKSSLLEALSLSKQENKLIKAENEELVSKLNEEKQKFKELKEDIQRFGMTFVGKTELQVALLTKLKAMSEKIKTLKVPCDV